MSRAIIPQEAMVPELELSLPKKVVGLIPIAAPIVVAILFILWRIQAGHPVLFIYSDALVMLALISYICAAVVARVHQLHACQSIDHEPATGTSARALFQSCTRMRAHWHWRRLPLQPP